MKRKHGALLIKPVRQQFSTLIAPRLFGRHEIFKRHSFRRDSPKREPASLEMERQAEAETLRLGRRRPRAGRAREIPPESREPPVLRRSGPRAKKPRKPQNEAGRVSASPPGIATRIAGKFARKNAGRNERTLERGARMPKLRARKFREGTAISTGDWPVKESRIAAIFFGRRRLSPAAGRVGRSFWETETRGGMLLRGS